MTIKTTMISRIAFALLACAGLGLVGCASRVDVGCGGDGPLCPGSAGAVSGCGVDGTICPDTSGVATGKKLYELTDADRDAWCKWYVATIPDTPPGIDPSAPTPRLSPDGTAINAASVAACLAPHTDVGPCFEWLTIAECKLSLAAQPCTATVQALDDCVGVLFEAYRSDRANNATWTCSDVTSRCDALRSAASCDETVVGLGGPGVGGFPCKVRAR